MFFFEFSLSPSKGTEFLPQINYSNPYIFATWGKMMLTFDILNLDYMIEKNSLFEISKVYNIGLLRYRD